MPDEFVTSCINKDYLTLPYLTVLSLFPSKTGETYGDKYLGLITYKQAFLNAKPQDCCS